VCKREITVLHASEYAIERIVHVCDIGMCVVRDHCTHILAYIRKGVLTQCASELHPTLYTRERVYVLKLCVRTEKFNMGYQYCV
jgi:hypothetical protein